MYDCYCIVLYFIDFRSHFDKLCKYLGNQIIYLCRKTIDINTILDSNVEMSLDLIQKSLDCCELFIMVYTEVIIGQL